ncbi:MAG TPA: site-2 protease family protein [Patescibacteria group bacterium]|nr:site-2 protease family protein [Patescibacteria group bacterium]
MEFLIPLVVLIFSAILHEIMHGVVADKLGDPTARLMGRLTLNPIPHIDPFMSILVPALLVISGSPIIFGAAKPVPVNPIHFKDPKKDMALVSLAGPLTNLFIAIVAAQFIRFIHPDFVINQILYIIVLYNLMLGFVNLIPIPPLDGSKVLAAFLPNQLAITYLSIERYGIFILFALLLFPIGGISLGDIISGLILFSVHALGI